MNHFDVMVVGGGPAGAAFAHAVAQKRRRVIVFEKNAIPPPRVCGGVLSPRTWRALRHLELDQAVRRIPAQPLRFIEVEHVCGKNIRIPFPFHDGEVCVVNRSALDAVLWKAAGRAGAEMRERAMVQRVLRMADDPGSWRVEVRSGTIEMYHARALVGADGRHSFVAAQRGLFAQGEGRSHCFQFQLQRHDFLREGVHFFIFWDGYCGLSVDGEGVAHLDVISLRGGESEDALKERLFAQRSAFVEKLERAIFHPDRPMARAPIGSGCRPFPEESSLALLGDAQVWVEPFTGEGIAMALESAWRAAEDFCAGDAFRRWTFSRSRTNGWVAQALKSPWKARAILRLLTCLPSLARWMTRDVLNHET